MQKVRTAHRLPDPGQLCLIPGLHDLRVARYNGNGGFVITGYLTAYRAADRVDWWAAIPPEFTAQCGEPDGGAESRVGAWGQREVVRNG